MVAVPVMGGSRGKALFLSQKGHKGRNHWVSGGVRLAGQGNRRDPDCPYDSGKRPGLWKCSRRTEAPQGRSRERGRGGSSWQTFRARRDRRGVILLKR